MKILSLAVFSYILCPVVGQIPAPIATVIENLVPTIFNTVSFAATGFFNGFVGTALDAVDPYTLDKNENKELGEFDVEGCGETKVVANATFQDVTGISTMEIDALEMTTFDFTDSGLVSGFKLGAGSDEFSANFVGTLGTPDCDSDEDTAFEGVAGISSPKFVFSFDSNVTLFTGFSIESVNITSFAFEWDSIGIDINDGDLGDAEEIITALEEQFVGIAENLVSSFIDEEFLQSTIDNILPFP